MEIIGILIVASVVLYVLKGALSIFSGPKQANYFVCSSCGTRVKHSPRTLAAWKNGLRTSTCGNCHRQWLAAQAAAKQSQTRSSFLGCLVLLVIVAVVIIVASQ